MEKKNRSVQGSAKGSGTEVKKNQDVSGGKPWPRNGRRRESPNSSLSAKFSEQPTRKQNHNRTVEKRPRPRGTYYSGSAGGKEDARLATEGAEVGSVFVLGSKKQSLNHLLNFDYNWPSHMTRSAGKVAGNRGFATQKHKYNKEQFLQANCQFVVNSTGDYKQFVNNPDALVNWDYIEQVNVEVSESPSCPICLDTPTPAKITRCGHIYCWSCILHYLELSEKTWRKCPICYEAVHKADLKSVVSVTHKPFNSNEIITFRLMKRARGCLTAYPADADPKPNDTLFNVSDPESKKIYSKLLIAGKPEILDIIERERAELLVAIREDPEESERCFLEQALERLRERENCVLSGLDVEINSRTNESVDDEEESDGAYGTVDVGVTEEQATLENSFADYEEMQKQPVKYYYFYQASDGQHIYLHTINVRMLEQTYGSLEHCPITLTGRIVEKEGGSMTEELRKRFRCLQHLPVTCQFEVAEIQLKPPIVTKETLEIFNEQLKSRKKKRQNRARDEKRREKKIAEEENRKMGKYPTPILELESHQQFPECGFEPTPTEHHQRTESESTSRSDESLLSPPLLAGSWGNDSDGISFAKMVSAKKPTQDTWPGLKSSKPGGSGTSAEAKKLINVTGYKPTTVYSKLRNDSESDEADPEAMMAAPAFSLSFGDAITMAMQRASLGNDSETNGGGGKRKKKGKQRLLFATTMAYSGKD